MPGTPQNGQATNTFAIDNTQRYTVFANTPCSKIAIRENYRSNPPATADLLMARPPGATLVSVSKGGYVIFTPLSRDRFFGAGEPVGEIQTVSGSITMQQVET